MSQTVYGCNHQRLRIIFACLDRKANASHEEAMNVYGDSNSKGSPGEKPYKWLQIVHIKTQNPHYNYIKVFYDGKCLYIS